MSEKQGSGEEEIELFDPEERKYVEGKLGKLGRDLTEIQEKHVEKISKGISDKAIENFLKGKGGK